jgi:hypothetical protein
MGASMDTDNDASKALYGKEISAKKGVSGGRQLFQQPNCWLTYSTRHPHPQVKPAALSSSPR